MKLKIVHTSTYSQVGADEGRFKQTHFLVERRCLFIELMIDYIDHVGILVGNVVEIHFSQVFFFNTQILNGVIVKGLQKAFHICSLTALDTIVKKEVDGVSQKAVRIWH